MRRNLSSSWTFFYKVVLPVLWIGGFAVGTLSLFLVEPSSWSPSPPTAEMRWAFLGGTLLGSLFLYWFGMRLKTVALDGDVLVISDRGRDVLVPLRDVERVSGSVLMNPELIWLHFRRPTDFGTKVLFMPPLRFFGRYTRHPLVAELEALIARAEVGPGGP